MKKIVCFLLLWSFGAWGATIPADYAVLQGMDKVTGRVRELSLPVGASIDFGELTITVDKCLTKTPEETPENAAYLRIFQQENKIFSGWMFSSNPALSAMEDPVYDIWVVECISEKSENLEASEILNEQPADTVNESEIED